MTEYKTWNHQDEVSISKKTVKLVVPGVLISVDLVVTDIKVARFECLYDFRVAELVFIHFHIYLFQQIFYQLRIVFACLIILLQFILWQIYTSNTTVSTSCGSLPAECWSKRERAFRHMMLDHSSRSSSSRRLTLSEF